MNIGLQPQISEASHYWYPQDNGVIIVELGPAPRRWWYPTLKAAASMQPLLIFQRINPPPNQNPEWYIGDGLQWRKEPVRRPGFMREWLHGIVGAVTGGIPFVPLWLAPQVWPLVVFGALFTALGVWLFIRYEETEEAEIKDWAYRDIGGYMNGLALVSGLCAVATAALYKLGVYCDFTGAFC